MKKNIYTFTVLFIIFINSIAAQTIQFNNPSFEGTPAAHVTPPGWDICMPGVTPDTQPGFWGITLPPSNGFSYAGLVYNESIGWQEGAGQTLSTSLIAGTNYYFSIDLAVPASADSVTGILVPPYCAQLQLWGGMSGINSGCDQSELLWTSPIVSNTTWQTYYPSFTPTQNWDHLLFLIYAAPPACTDGQYLMLDNIVNAPLVVFTEDNITICANPATISASSGYDHYLWSNGDTTQSTAVTSSGMYYITATFNNIDIIDSINVTLTQPYLNLNLGNDTVICSNASIIVNASNGFADYLWNTGATNPSITVQQTGTYNVYAADTANCSYYDTINIVINPSQSLNLGNDTAFCDYDTITLDAGIAFNSFQWSTGETTQTIIIDSTGTYYVTATNTQCSATVFDTITCTFNAAPLANAGLNDTICYGTSTTLQATGGINYLWSPASNLTCPTCSTTNASPTSTTTYIVTITNTYGCTASDNVTINVSDATVSTINATCGLHNGEATVNITGGSGVHSYIWNTIPAQNTQTAINLASGTYTVSITDSILNCTIVKTVTIANIAGPTVSITNIINANCGLNNGAITVTVSGGSAPYTYVWNTTPPQTTINLGNVPVGDYCLTVTDSNDCPDTICVSVIAVAYSAPEICMVTFDTASNHNMVVWEKPVTTGIDNYYIYRETSISGIYNLIGVQDYSALSTFIDTTSIPLQQPYRYKLVINDNCGFTSLQSAYHQTIHLTVYEGSGTWNLLWNDYEGFSFSTYNIYRGTTYSNMTLINSVANNVTSYTDLTPPPGVLYYMIEAVRPTSCIPTSKSFSSTTSNIASSNNIGIDESNKVEMIQIYPNPGLGIFNVSIINPSFNSAILEIVNPLGQLLYTTIQNKPTQSIDISNFSNGIYILKATFGDNIFMLKFVKE